MGSRHVLPLILSLCCSASLAHAESDVVVQSLIMPAWVQHEGRTRPLSVGMPLVDGDRLTTGGQARVLLRSADGSDIKLGENATLTLSQLSKQRSDPTLFTAFLDVARGAFRFTTSAVAKLRHRDVSIRVADATIGIRGTDVWGKDGEDKRVVCLIEGKISVQGKDSASFVMDKALTFYEMPKDLPIKAVAPVPTDKLAKWALETEISPKQGAATRSGSWKVTLFAVNDDTQALSAYDEWRNAGYDVKIHPIAASNGYQYQLLITQLATRADAEHLAASVQGKMGALEPTVSH
ncbi:MAG: FecR domain-containing protein [Gallionella sp.]|nr:FecR domain-containing protein [Gallionella sp.]